MASHHKAKLDITYNNVIVLTQKKYRAYKLSNEQHLDDRVFLLDISTQGVFGAFYTLGSQNRYIEMQTRFVDLAPLASLQLQSYELLDDEATSTKMRDLTLECLESFSLLFHEIVETIGQPIQIIVLSGEPLLYDLGDFFIKLEAKIQEISPLTFQTRLLNKSREFNIDLLQNVKEIVTAPVGIGINIKERIYMFEMIDIEQHTIDIVREGELVKEGESFSLVEAIRRDHTLAKYDRDLFTHLLAYGECELEIILYQGDTQKIQKICLTKNVPYFAKDMTNKSIDLRISFQTQELLSFELICKETQEAIAFASFDYRS